MMAVTIEIISASSLHVRCMIRFNDTSKEYTMTAGEFATALGVWTMFGCAVITIKKSP